MADKLWSPEVGEKIDAAQIRKLHDLGFPSRAELGFAEVIEVMEVVDYDTVTINFDVGRLGYLGLPVARIRRWDRELPRRHEHNCAGYAQLRSPKGPHEHEGGNRTQPEY